MVTRLRNACRRPAPGGGISGDLRRRLLPLAALAVVLAASVPAERSGASAGTETPAVWRQVHPHWRRAYVLSFRSPDLLSYEPDERWGEEDGRLVGGGILTEFPEWLAGQGEALEAARRTGRPILLSLHLHSGFGTGLVTYTPDLQSAEVANYPWLVRTLAAAGLDGPDVTVAVDTCNAQAVAAHQLRRDLIPQGVEAFPPFARWRRAHPLRRRLPLTEAYRLFAQDRVSGYLAPPARGRRARVKAAPLRPLSREEWSAFRAGLYGPRGVILATPAFFNLLRLGPDPRGTLTANLRTDPLERRVLEGLLYRNLAEFRRFREFGFLAAAGLEPAEGAAARTSPAGPAPVFRLPRGSRGEN